MAETYNGKCFCGAIELQATGAPEVMGYCHCESCRSWSAGPVNAFTLWKPETVTITKGAEHIGKLKKTDASDRQFCTKCGGHILTDHPAMGLVDVYAATLPSLKFEPVVHVHYGESVLPIKDGLPKMKDTSAASGGSGETIPE